MDHSSLRRLLVIGAASILWAWLMLSAGAAYAYGTVAGDETVTPTTVYTMCGSAQACYRTGPSATAVCQAWISHQDTVDQYHWSYDSNSEIQCNARAKLFHATTGEVVYNSPRTGTINSHVENVVTVECAAGSSEVGGQCVCNIGTKGNGGASCEPIDCKAEVQNMADVVPFMHFQTEDGGLTQCHKGCSVRGDLAATTPGTGITTVWGGQWTGAYCEGTNNPNPTTAAERDGKTMDPAPEPLPKGKCPGTVNGTPVVVDCSEKAAGNETKTTNPDGTTTTTTKETKCYAGSCTTTTTTTTKDSSGNVTGTSTSTSIGVDTLDGNSIGGIGGNGSGSTGGDGGDCTGDDCGEEPDSTFGGSCVASFECGGDAIQCAIARDQHIRHCEVFENETAATLEGTAAATAGKHPTDHPYVTGTSTPLDFSTGIDQTELIAGTCPADQTFTVLGSTVVAPFSAMCTPLGWMGNVAVAVTFLACVFVVFGKRE